MKAFKGLMSCILIVAVFMLSQTAVFAINTSEDAVSIKKDVANVSEVVLSDDENGKVILRGEDYTNGDVCFYIVENGNVTSSSYVDRNKRITTHTDYITKDVIKEELLNIKPYESYTGAEASTLAATSYTSAGRVGYLLHRTIQGETFIYGPSYLNVQYLKETFSPQYDINGKYKNAAALAARIAALFVIATNITIPIALQVLSALGIIETATNFVIGTNYVKADQTKVTWRAEGGTSGQTIVGSKYVFRLNNGMLGTEYAGDYFATTSIANHNSTLALKLAKIYYPGMSKYEIYSWG